MLDLKYIRENAEAVQENSRNRGVEADVGLVVELADRRSALIQELNELRQRQNQMARSIGKEQDPESRDRLIAESRAMKDRIPEKEADLSEVERPLREELLKIPNITHPDAPIGKDDSENVEIRRWGEIPDFDFDVRDHVELGESLGVIDFDAGAKVTGSKFYFLRGDAVLLELGLVRYAMDILTQRGYQPTITPDLARDEMLVGTGFIPRGPETQIYSVEDSDLCSHRHLRDTSRRLAGRRDRRRERASYPPSRPLALLPHRGRLPRPREPRPLPRPPVHQGGDVRLHARPSNQTSCTRRCSTSRSASSRASGSLTASSTPAPATSAAPPTASSTWKPGCRAAARRRLRRGHEHLELTDYQARRLRIRYRRDGGTAPAPPYPERHGHSSQPCPHSAPGELPAGGRLDTPPRGTRPLCWQGEVGAGSVRPRGSGRGRRRTYMGCERFGKV